MPSFAQSFNAPDSYIHDAGTQDSEDYPGGADQYILHVDGSYTGLQLIAAGRLGQGTVWYPIAAALQHQSPAGNFLLAPDDGASVRYLLAASVAYFQIQIAVQAISGGTVNLELLPYYDSAELR